VSGFCAPLRFAHFSLAADQLWWQCLQCSWTSSRELFTDGPQTAGLVLQPFQSVTEYVLFGQWDQSAGWI